MNQKVHVKLLTQICNKHIRLKSTVDKSIKIPILLYSEIILQLILIKINCVSFLIILSQFLYDISQLTTVLVIIITLWTDNIKLND